MNETEKNQSSESTIAELQVEVFKSSTYSVLSQACLKNEQIFVEGANQELALAILLAQEKFHSINGKSHLIIVSDTPAAEKIKRSLKFFDPQIKTNILPHFDVSPYSGLYPNPRQTAHRLRWLFHAYNSKPGEIFIAPVLSLCQKTIPCSVFNQFSKLIKIGESLPVDLNSWLHKLGYTQSPLVEDLGTYSQRGGIFDIYSPAHRHPIRVELFGDIIDSIRFFDPSSQRSLNNINQFNIIPTKETIYYQDSAEEAIARYKQDVNDLPVSDIDKNEMVHALVHENYFNGIEFLLPYFYEQPESPLSFFNDSLNVWHLDNESISKSFDEQIAQLNSEKKNAEENPIQPKVESLYQKKDEFPFPENSLEISLSKILIREGLEVESDKTIDYKVYSLSEFEKSCAQKRLHLSELGAHVADQVKHWKQQEYTVYIAAKSQNSSSRIKALLDSQELVVKECSESEYLWEQWSNEQSKNNLLVHIIPRAIEESLRSASDNLLIIKDDDIFGSKQTRKKPKSSSKVNENSHALNFSDLKPGDFVVHKTHGVGIYEGLKTMPIGGVDAEFIQLNYKNNDKLYLPVYRIGQIQRFSGPSTPKIMDKLGGTQWAKTKTKVKKHLRDIANDLLQLYAKKAQAHRDPLGAPDEDFIAFENSFPYEETDDQLKAINDILSDLNKDTPMDRLVCGDVGFGKTEVAMRAAFKVAQSGRQVCIIAPTTILSFQHLENFKKRFKGWPLSIKALNRFIPKPEQKKTVEEMKSGQVDIIIGTHRLLSKDIAFKNLGLLVIDEEQKFGVRHKEKIRKLKVNVDTLAMSATPIPRTLNMALVGIRDLSLINTAPIDRLPTRTFICRFDKETIRKAVESEVHRGGQVFFIHNRVQSIYATLDELRQILPKIRFGVGHGQMEEDDLEKTMVSFFNHEIDVLVCTTIIESGMDIPRANTMFVDNAHQFGLSQLYQLRGRVGRSKERAYCYLIVPRNRKLDSDAQERLRVLQENTALGSGIRIAQYDLELRGAGDFLGEHQSGHISAVGYELYLELLEETIKEAKGEPVEDRELDPEINLRIPAFIPDSYIPDIRLRLGYYKTLTQINGPEDLDKIEDDLRDQFGKLPEQVLNLMGIMLIRKVCKDLQIKDISAGKANISLSFTNKTSISPERVIELTSQQNKKYGINPENRLMIRIKEITWPRIYEELMLLEN